MWCLLLLSCQINHRLPDRIIVFRDGVGDGQMATVRDYEVAQLEQCFQSVGEYGVS